MKVFLLPCYCRNFSLNCWFLREQGKNFMAGFVSWDYVRTPPFKYHKIKLSEIVNINESLVKRLASSKNIIVSTKLSNNMPLKLKSSWVIGSLLFRKHIYYAEQWIEIQRFTHTFQLISWLPLNLDNSNIVLRKFIHQCYYFAEKTQSSGYQTLHKWV